MKKRQLSGAVLQKHLTKTVRDLDEFNAETERIIAETNRMKVNRLTSANWDKAKRSVALAIASGSAAGLIAVFAQPKYVSPAILCGFSLGLSSGLLKR
jgi:hypothetical protein